MFDLKRFRKEKKISQTALAKKLGIGQSFISQIESGKDPMPDALISKLIDIYEIDNAENYTIAQVNEALKLGIERIKINTGLKQADIAEKIGINSTYLSDMINGRVPLTENVCQQIFELFHISILDNRVEEIGSGVTSTHTLHGIPQNIPKNENVITGKLIPYYDAEAAAGNSYEMSMEPVSRPVGMIEIGGLLKDSESALRVYGNSMTPNYPAGCVVGLRPHNDSFIEPGCVYVVETVDNRFLKRLYYNKNKTAFRCVSDNHMMHETGPMTGEYYYPEFDIPFDSVRRLFRVVGVIKRNIL